MEALPTLARAPRPAADRGRRPGPRRDRRVQARAGSFGTRPRFSFYPSKNLGALGDGGAICTDDGEIAERGRRLRNLGQRRKGEHVEPASTSGSTGSRRRCCGSSCRSSTPWNAARRGTRARYTATCSRQAAGRSRRTRAATCVYHLFPVRVADRDDVQRAPAPPRDRAPASTTRPALHRQPPLRERCRRPRTGPAATAVGGRARSSRSRCSRSSRRPRSTRSATRPEQQPSTEVRERDARASPSTPNRSASASSASATGGRTCCGCSPSCPDVELEVDLRPRRRASGAIRAPLSRRARRRATSTRCSTTTRSTRSSSRRPVFTHFDLASSCAAGRQAHLRREAARALRGRWRTSWSSSRSEQDRVLMCGHTFVYSPPVRAVKELLDREELGEIFFVSSSRVNLGLHQPDVSVDLGPRPARLLDPPLLARGDCLVPVRAVGRDSIVPRDPRRRLRDPRATRPASSPTSS